MARIDKMIMPISMDVLDLCQRAYARRAVFVTYERPAPARAAHAPALSITNDMPEAGGGGASAAEGAPEVAASDDDDDGDGDGDPDSDRRRKHSKSQSSPPPFAPALLAFASLEHYIGLGRSRIYPLIKAGKFPPPIKIGKSSRWLKTEIDAWIAAQSAQRIGG